MSETNFEQYAESIRRMDLRAGVSAIHPTALVAPGAVIGRNVNVGPYSVLGSDVVLEDEVWIDAHVSVSGRTRIGAGSRVWPFATLGVLPQDLKFKGERTALVIGKSNMIREYCNFSIGTEGGGGITMIGDNNLFMVHCHIGHDSQVANNCIFANGVSLAGHVSIHDHALLMGHVAVHQFCNVGRYALAAGGAMVTQDVAPFLMVHGNRAKENGLNLIGLKRAGFSNEQISDVKTMHKLVFRDSNTVDEAVAKIQETVPASSLREYFIEFVRSSERGLCR